MWQRDPGRWRRSRGGDTAFAQGSRVLAPAPGCRAAGTWVHAGPGAMGRHGWCAGRVPAACPRGPTRPCDAPFWSTSPRAWVSQDTGTLPHRQNGFRHFPALTRWLNLYTEAEARMSLRGSFEQDHKQERQLASPHLPLIMFVYADGCSERSWPGVRSFTEHLAGPFAVRPCRKIAAIPHEQLDKSPLPSPRGPGW